jgi:Type ISP C-terminal specificity domain
MPDQRDALRNIRTFPQLIKFLRDELDWPIESEDFEELTFDYTPEELGIDSASAAKIQEIKRLRPLSANQPWGIFFVKFEPKRLPVVVLRRVLSRVVLKKRASANSADRVAWQADDLLFISNYGEGEERQISFAHFSTHEEKADLPTLKVLGWDSGDTPLHLDDVSATLTTKLGWPEDVKDAERWRERWRSAFTLRHREVITTSQGLAVRLAELARAIRARIEKILAIETDNGPLTKLMKAFQQALIHDLSVDEFADMYAQTIAYGLLSARVASPTHDTADAVATHIPVTNPFLKELMETFLYLGGRKTKDRGGNGIDFDELGVSEVVDLLDAANMEAVVRDFGDRNREEDPVIHFYELFLKEYDAKKRMHRGVFYTPQPVVSYIVRSLHELLQTEFGLEEGLASTVTWAEMSVKHPSLKTPDGVNPADPFVVVLDPATGTATFLVEAIDLIYLTLVAKWKQQRLTDAQQQAEWNDYVPKHLLPRLHGYELLMAPYAIAHMKIGLKLYETGYRFGSDERAHIYLTNALEPPSDDSKQRTFAEWVPALAREALAVNAIKRHQRFTVVIGNPPYSLLSANLEAHHRVLIETYKFVDGERIRERGALQLEKNLNDDYVKFVRLCQLTVERAGVGVYGLITNHSFLDNPTMRGMRWSLLNSASHIWLLDLHGNSTKQEQPPEGVTDVNVFQIKQGVAISLSSRLPDRPAACEAKYHELWDTRQRKEAWLTNNQVGSHEWQSLEPTPDLYLFIPQSASLKSEFEPWPKLPDAMPTNGAGYITARDNLVIDFDCQAVVDRVQAFNASRLDDNSLLKTFDVANKKGWDVRRARAELKQVDIPKCTIRTNYRPFDSRWIFFDATLVWGRSWPTMQHIVGHPRNLTMLATRMTKDQWDVWAARTISSHKAMSAYDTNSVFPLYLVEDSENSQRSLARRHRLNFSAPFLKSLAIALGLPQKGEHGLPVSLTTEDIFHYAYSVFHSPGYRSRYAEFLKNDFPRLPLTENLDLFRALARVGDELVGMHLLESPTLEESLTTYNGPANPEIEKVSYARNTVWLDKAQIRGFQNVPEAVWKFHIGGYQVCEKWLKDRKGHTLSKDDITHYQKIVVALSETIRLRQEIDEIIEAHGGWPGAFQSAQNDSQNRTGEVVMER